jgi:hypothetical protein
MRINLLAIFLILIGITTMYHLLPKMKREPSIVSIHPRGFHQTLHINRSQLADALKKPTPIIAARARARRCADNCILREFMEIQI